MTSNSRDESAARAVVERWCGSKGDGWSIGKTLGTGGTASVFEVATPFGPCAFKLYEIEFSTGPKSEIEEHRIQQQLGLRGHDCPYLVEILDGGRFDEQLFLLMKRAPGVELEKHLSRAPRTKIRQILDQIARAAIFLRSKGLCHRDIKAANIYVTEDFTHSTLLDISVIREISDPVGIGTDRDGKLPIVATARYSPPEYLFRLVDPGPELWHALNIYQMGALLHDLVMREPLFQSEYAKSSQNRYRFAWVVSRVDPILSAEDVDRNLLFLARRALDKDWRTRSQLQLEDFLSDSNVQETNALKTLGIGVPDSQDGDTSASHRERVRTIATDLEGRVLQFLRSNGVRPEHSVQSGKNDSCKIIHLGWEPPVVPDKTTARHAQLTITLEVATKLSQTQIEQALELRMEIEGESPFAVLALPSVFDQPGAEDTLFDNSIEGLRKLAVQIGQSGTSG